MAQIRYEVDGEVVFVAWPLRIYRHKADFELSVKAC